MLLSALLAAQAAIAALTLAVTLFVLQTVAARREEDSRTYGEYVRQSGVRLIFMFSLAGVAVTGTALVAETLSRTDIPVLAAAPGARNLLILPILAFFQNLLMPLLLFERGLRLSRPDEWRKLRRAVDEHDVGRAVRAFLARKGLLEGGDLGDSDDGVLRGDPRDPDESAAAEAIEALLRDATIAMSDWRHGDFEWALESVGALVEFAMDELEREGIDWDLPGSVPYWPPLAEWRDTVDSFREEVITRGRPGYASQLAMLDRQLVLSGLKRSCGELFSAGLDGCVRNYDLAYGRRDRQLRDMLRNFTAEDLEWVFHSDHAGDVAYLREVIRHHARLLFHAMRHEDTDDFQWLRKALAEMLANGKSLWAHERRPRPTDEDAEDIEQISRYVVMGLAGYSLSLAEAGSLADSGPYIEAARSEYQSVQRLAGDAALPPDLAQELRFLWENLELSGPDRFGIGWVGPADYAPWFFSLRLVELAEDPMPEVGLVRTVALSARMWFDMNGDRVRSHVKLDGGLTLDERIVIVRDWLRAAAGPSG